MNVHAVKLSKVKNFSRGKMAWGKVSDIHYSQSQPKGDAKLHRQAPKKEQSFIMNPKFAIHLCFIHHHLLAFGHEFAIPKVPSLEEETHHARRKGSIGGIWTPFDCGVWFRRKGRSCFPCTLFGP